MDAPDFREDGAAGRRTLGRRERIRHASEFDRVFREGRRFACGDILFRYRPTALPHPRLGIAVGRAVGGSVRRNRIKRWIREAFRHAKGRIERPADIVAVARRGEHSLARIAHAFDALAAHLAGTRAPAPHRRAPR
ncbi:MAG: ribonuclease P protein component [Planctomycetes bacterium]|nr:ribonuclease P protein component [Planctomycetota bacterium]